MSRWVVSAPKLLHVVGRLWAGMQVMVVLGLADLSLTWIRRLCLAPINHQSSSILVLPGTVLNAGEVYCVHGYECLLCSVVLLPQIMVLN